MRSLSRGGRHTCLFINCDRTRQFVIMNTFLLFTLLTRCLAMHFYMNEGDEPQCFLLELGKDAMVAEKHSVWEFEENSGKWVRDDTLQVEISIDELFDNNHRVYSQKHSPFGKFEFVAHDGGEHKVCYRPLANGWFHKNKVKIELDFVLGTGNLLDPKSRKAIGSVSDRVSEINRKLITLRREQMLMREREAAFRDQSELTNSKVSRLTVLQILVLVATCAWQVHHLRGFFTKQKLV